MNSRTRNRRRGGLGTIATMVNGSLVNGSSPIRFRPVGPARPFPIYSPPPVSTTPIPVPTTPTTPIRTPPFWGGNPPRWSGGTSGPQPVWNGPQPVNVPGYANPGAQSSQQYGGLTYQQLQQIASTNPGVLTPQQYAAAQQAGFIAGTVPYSEASQINPSAALAQSAAGYSTPISSSSGTDIGTTLSTTYAGLPLYLWLLIGGGAFLMFRGKGR